MPRPEPPAFNGEWYSICSAHMEYTPHCPACNAGRWVSHAEHEMSQWLWKYSPRIWRKWANRKPDLMLEEIFPKLKGHHISQLPERNNMWSWYDRMREPWHLITAVAITLVPLAFMVYDNYEPLWLRMSGAGILLFLVISRIAVRK